MIFIYNKYSFVKGKLSEEFVQILTSLTNIALNVEGQLKHGLIGFISCALIMGLGLWASLKYLTFWTI
jgi:hypothetical protein